MADRVFSIDFGSAYTKVALRRDPGADAEILRPSFRAVGAVDFCFPSTVVVEKQGARSVPVFGAEAMSRRPGANVTVHSNWKRKVFLGAEPGQAPRRPPIDALLESPELQAAAAKYGVSESQLVHLQNLVANARSLAGASLAGPAPIESQERSLASALAPHFFQWLRSEVLRACERLKAEGLNPATIPVRFTVPAFAEGSDLIAHPGCQLLMNAATRAGWPLHPDRPIVSEPYTNAIGVLTGGANVVSKAKLQFGKMFNRGPLITALAHPEDHPTFRAIVIDVGAFTTDFATLTIKTEGKMVEDPDLSASVRQHSVPLGMSDLDARVMDALTTEKREWLTKVAEPVEVEAFRESVYTAGKPYRTVAVGAIGGTADSEAIKGGMQSFLASLSREAAQFCDALEPVGMQELILTGGGTTIPAVRDSLLATASESGRTFVKTHAAGIKKGAVQGVIDSLKEDALRGGSALGGASIYFEKEYY